MIALVVVVAFLFFTGTALMLSVIASCQPDLKFIDRLGLGFAGLVASAGSWLTAVTLPMV